jgi:hypothetical protein
MLRSKKWILSSLHFYLPDMVNELSRIIDTDKVSEETCPLLSNGLEGE